MTEEMSGADTKPKQRPWTDRQPREFGALTAQQYIDERLNPIRAWYDKKANDAKRNYLWMRTATVVGGAIVPVLASLDLGGYRWVTTAISLLVVILLSLESVLHFREQWKNYRSTEQSLEKEYYNFTAADGAYKGMAAAKAFVEFVDRVESTIGSENAATLNVMTTANEQARQAKPAEAALPAATTTAS